MKPRKNEQIGGGYFVFRRGKKTGRISCGGKGRVPFEHSSAATAAAQAARLAGLFPGEIFEVFGPTGITSKVEKEQESTP